MPSKMMDFFIEVKFDFWLHLVVQLARTMDAAPTFLIRKSRQEVNA